MTEILASIKTVQCGLHVDAKTGACSVVTRVVLEGDVDETAIKDLVRLQTAGELTVAFSAVQGALKLKEAQ